MGLSASQARLLSLTSRLSDLEFQAQSISNCKIRLADASAQASEDYENALNKQKITVTSNGSTYIDASAYNLTTYGAVSTVDKQRYLVDAENRVLVGDSVGKGFDNSQNTKITVMNADGTSPQAQTSALELQTAYKSVDAYLKAKLGYSTEAEAATAKLTYDAGKVTYYTNCYNGKEAFLNSQGYTSNSKNTDSSLKYDSGAVPYYSNVFDKIKSNGYNAPGDSNMKDSAWLYTQLNSGNIFLEEQTNNDANNDGVKDWEKVSYSSGDATLKTDSDDTETAKAEAEYNKVMAQIEAKDKRFDLQLKQIDTEHQAIQTEMDSVKKVIDKNIERSFKIFDA